MISCTRPVRLGLVLLSSSFLWACQEADQRDAKLVADLGMVSQDTGSSVEPDPRENIPNGPWELGHTIENEPQKDGDPDEGFRILVETDYIGCGVPFRFFRALLSQLGSNQTSQNLADREGKAATVPYSWNVVERASGAEIVTQNCFTCHAGSFNGELIWGLGNATSDFTSDLSAGTEGLTIPDTLVSPEEKVELEKLLSRLQALGPSTVMRTVGNNPAEMVAVTLAAHRDRNTLEWSDVPLVEIPDIVVTSDPPPWWWVHKKHALFYNGMARGDHRGTMMFASSLCTDTVEQAEEINNHFHHVQSYIESLRAPQYPFEIDESQASRGEPLFIENCAGCHGTYSENEADETYPNLLLPLEVIGTDPVVAMGGIDHAPYLVEWYNESYYGQATRLEPNNPYPGYVAPPLDGIWATGPFLHNGSVPTIELVLNSAERPTYWKRVDYDSSHFDERALGWPFEEMSYGQAEAPEDERKFIYDTTHHAYSNAGHTFGDHLSEEDRGAILEYLKTL
jgi:mono/diheme cytochrome c family protein